MKPSLQTIERRLEALENSPQIAPGEPLTIHITEVDTDGREVTTEWETTRYTSPDGREIIVEQSKRP